MFAPESKNSEVQLNRTYDTRGGSKTGRKKIKVVNLMKDGKVKNAKVSNFKKSVPNECQNLNLTKDTTKIIIDAKANKPSQEITEASNKDPKKVKKVKIKEVKPLETQDKKDSKILKKLAEVHSFHQPPLPKLEDQNQSMDISMDDIMIGEELGRGAYAVVK